MGKIKIFFSYQWSTGDVLRAAIISFLEKLENVEVIVDKNVVQPSDIIHETISENLDACDCVLASTKSFASMEVVSELVRADERGKKIYILKDRNDDDDSIPSCLYFLEDKLHVNYNGIDDLNNKLTDLFNNKTKEDFDTISPNLRKIQKEVDLRTLPTFKGELIKRVLKEANREIIQLKQKEYKIDVGAEKNFLVRARTIFENATEIYAVSIDSVSTFWTDQRNRNLAETYIKSQPNNTIRLFVFCSPRAANKYKFILQANHNSYGQDGRVYICSLHSYKTLIEKFSDSAEVDYYTNKDFGILVYNNDSISNNNKRHYVEAFLDHSELSFKSIDISRPNKLNHRGLIEYFHSLSDLDFNTFSETEGRNTKKIVVKRWNPRCVTDNYLWRDELKRLFPEERYGDVYHLVFFRGYDDALESRIREVKNALERDKDSMRIRTIWFGKKADKYPVADFQYGSLRVGFDYEYILIMSFSSYEDLRVYYADKKHSDLRKGLYKHLDKSLELLYSYLDELKEKDPQKGSEIFESTIEGIVSNHMSRYDFVDKEDIDSIVTETPYYMSFEYDP